MVETYTSIRKSIKIVAIKFEGRCHFGERRRKDINIKFDVKEICHDNLQWIQLSQDGFR
jgi:hypothetical protein